MQMKIGKPAMVLALSAMVASNSSATEPAPKATETRLSKEAIVEDLRFLRAALDEGHPGAYRYRDSKAVDAAFGAAERALGENPDLAQGFSAVSRAAGSIGDGHTRVRLPKDDQERIETTDPLLPFRFFVIGGRLYVAYDLRDSAGPKSLAGQEILTIDGRAAATLIDEVMRSLEGDGSIPDGRLAKMRTFRFNTMVASLFGSRPNYRIALADGTSIDVAGVPLTKTIERWGSRFPAAATPPPASLDFADGKKIAILTIRTFGGFADMDGKVPLEQFLAQSFAQIRSDNCAALIVDVRRNGGGRDRLGRQLLEYLAPRPFRYYDALYLKKLDFSFAKQLDPWRGPPPGDFAALDDQGRLRLTSHSNYGEHQPSADRFRGPIFILMDGGSFSTTAEFLSLAHFNKVATFVGEESGGGYYGNTSFVVPTLTLPRTGIRVGFPLVRYDLAVSGFRLADRGVPPDVRVDLMPADLAANRDPVLDKALELARKAAR